MCITFFHDKILFMAISPSIFSELSSGMLTECLSGYQRLSEAEFIVSL